MLCWATFRFEWGCLKGHAQNVIDSVFGFWCEFGIEFLALHVFINSTSMGEPGVTHYAWTGATAEAEPSPA